MSTNLKISIVTVCYNSAATIRDTIESVLSQAYKNIEYIIVDGASTDGTLDIVNEYKDQGIKVLSEPDKGIYDAMNKGINLASGEVIGILNSDDFYEDGSVLENVSKAFYESPECDLVFGNVVFVKPNNLERIVRYYNASHFKPWKLRFGWMPPHPATFIRRKAYQKAGFYSVAYKIAADYEVFIRMLLINGFGFKRLDKVLIRMRLGGASTAGLKSSIALNKEIIKACKDNGVYTNWFFVLSKLPFKLLELLKRPSGNPG